MKLIPHLLFVLFLSTGIFVQAQEKTITKSELAALTFVSEEDIRENGYAIDITNISFYGMDKKLLATNTAIKMVTSGDYGADLYMDASGKITTALLRPSTAEEKAAIKKQQEDFKVTDPSSFVGKDAVPFELTDINGTPYKMADLKGKVVVINFWFIGCPPCIKEIPELNELVALYKNKEVVFLGIATDRKKDLVKFLNTKSFNYNIVPNGRALAMEYGIMGYPSHVVIGKNAKVTYGASGFGPGSVDALAQAITAAIHQ